jgi:exodeoxyribonuclease V beta subunit
MKEFDILRIPLEGAHLVEANAGTGKTYALAGLFLRLILENDLSPSEILVVTYTRAATQELRDRIRRMMRQALDFSSGHIPMDPFIERLMKRQQDLKRSLETLTRAIRGLDEAAVFTIHGFCQRLLQENAFETGSLFDVELTTRGQDLDQEIVEDFWRNHICTGEPEFVHFLFQKKWSTQYLLRFLDTGLKHPDIHVIPTIKTSRLPTLRTYRKTLDSLRKRWSAVRDDVRAMLMDPGIKGTAYGVTRAEPGLLSPRELRISAMVAGMDQFLSAQRPPFPPFPDIEKFSAGKLAASMKKGCLPPGHEFFALCEGLWEQKTALAGEMDQALMFLKGRLFHYLRDERVKRKALRNIRTYQDLLTDSLAALEQGGKETFIRNVRSKYRAALIDEFQDTDPVQYRIFHTLFGNGKMPLFYIGDPKQAIYGFRGADVATYLKAAGSVPNTRTLRMNWRSKPELVRAVNTLFSGIEKPFVYPEITYTPSEASERMSSPVLRVEGDRGTPFRICLLHQPEEGETYSPLAKKKAWPGILKFVATEVARLVTLGRSGKAFIGDEPLSERDIAILVRKNREARLMQDTFRQMGIPSVLYNAGDIFETREAAEVRLILHAIAEPGHEGHVKAALASDVMGMDGSAIQALAEQEDAWEQRILDFREYHRIWEEQGFIPMFRRLLTREKVRVRLLAFPDGERRFTNILHLGEVLHRAALDERLGLTGLTTWLFRKMEDDSHGDEEQLLRLETDEEAVKIVTVHKSKGLEYPVVFCPSLWDGGWSAEKEVIFHDPDNNLELTMDLGSEEKERHAAVAREELLAENLRLLYVALTRAQQRCYVVWGCIRDAETSALAYVLHTRNTAQEENPVERARKALLSRPWEVLVGELSRLEQDSAGTIAVEDLITRQWSGSAGTRRESARIEGRIFSVRIPRDWKISSFSSLSPRQKLDPDIPDHDFAVPPQPSPEEEMEDTPIDFGSGIFAFPKGARAGTCLHDILEHLNFTKTGGPSARNLIAEKLHGYGFAETWTDTIQEMVQKVLSTCLDPADPGLRLQKISAKARVHELEFVFPLKTIAPDVLQGLFATHGNPELYGDIPQKIERLHFSPVRGFLKGFMDLVFQWQGRYYLVDWKSNFLGKSIEDYGPDGLREAMKEGYYHLQYHLYTLALDRYLRIRLPGYQYESVFGGVFYLFLRGMDPARGADFGIFRDWPSPDLVHAMREILIP